MFVCVFVLVCVGLCVLSGIVFVFVRICLCLSIFEPD